MARPSQAEPPTPAPGAQLHAAGADFLTVWHGGLSTRTSSDPDTHLCKARRSDQEELEEKAWPTKPIAPSGKAETRTRCPFGKSGTTNTLPLRESSNTNPTTRRKAEPRTHCPFGKQQHEPAHSSKSGTTNTLPLRESSNTNPTSRRNLFIYLTPMLSPPPVEFYATGSTKTQCPALQMERRTLWHLVWSQWTTNENWLRQ